MVKNVVTCMAVVVLGLSLSSVAEAGKRRTEVEKLEHWEQNSKVSVRPNLNVGETPAPPISKTRHMIGDKKTRRSSSKVRNQVRRKLENSYN